MNTKDYKQLVTAICGALALSAGTVWATPVSVIPSGYQGSASDRDGISSHTSVLDVNEDSNVVYEKVELFQLQTFFTEKMNIPEWGTYKATLTDFEFPQPMLMSGLHIGTATDSLLRLDGPGSDTFSASAGTHYLSFFGLASHGFGVMNGGYHAGNNHGRRGDFMSHQNEGHSPNGIGWPSKFRAGGMVPPTLGQYGIEIAQLQSPTAVPVPAAAWLFGSGLIGLMGVSRRKRI